MNYLAASVLTVFAFPCLAAALTEQFSLMDINKDGFLSETEFVNGMRAMSETKNVSAVPVQTVSDEEKKKIIDEAISQSKNNLPYKIDDAMVWTDVYAENNEIHYVYKVEMDISALAPGQIATLKPVLQKQICSTVVPSMCGVVKDILLEKGIPLVTHYNDKTGAELVSCRLTEADCP